MVTQGSLSDAHGFAPVNLDDHRAWLWVVGLLSCTYSVLALAARITGKWGLLFWDDAVLGIGYVCGATVVKTSATADTGTQRYLQLYTGA